MWYIITGCVITLAIAILLIVMDYKARKFNPNVPEMPAVVAIGLIGCIIAWPILILASIPLLWEIIEDLVNDYKFGKEYDEKYGKCE